MDTKAWEATLQVSLSLSKTLHYHAHVLWNVRTTRNSPARSIPQPAIALPARLQSIASEHDKEDNVRKRRDNWQA